MFAAISMVACTTTQDPATRTNGINDPYEAQNRAIHGFNKGLDKNFVRPVSKGYAAVVPFQVRDSVNDFADNLSLPGTAINSLLQADFRGAGIAAGRFVINTTIGVAGLFDPASEANIPDQTTDFGETLAVWGVGEGAYIEMPVFGPSTQRDAVGFVVDLFTNPLTFVTVTSSPENLIPPTARTAAWLNSREKISSTIDSILYESADSYAQSRTIYLQNRRFALGDSGVAEEDPYLDPYGSAEPDGSLDPYDSLELDDSLDPYAQ